MEDAWSAHTPYASLDSVVFARIAGHRSQRSNFHPGLGNLEKEGERFFCPFSVIRLSNELVLRSEALAASTVKIAGRDVLATWKGLIALVVTPILYALYAVFATLVAIRANAPLFWRIATPFLVFFILPFISYAALKFGEAGMDIVK